MSGPSSLDGLGQALPDEVHRERLITRLAERWNRRLVTLRAPGGYGKSTALSQALRDNETDPTGIDVYVRCRRSITGLAELESAVAGAFDAPADGADSGAQLASRIIDLMSAFSPQDVCLCLDDVHALDGLSDFAEMVDVLIDGLPFNGHLMLAGRSLPPIRLAKLRAGDDVEALDQSDLTFTDSELHELAKHHGVPVDRLASAAGWPAVSRLLVVADRDVSVEFMIEEVIAQLRDAERVALALSVIAAPATTELFDELAPGTDVAALIADVPLLADLGDGAISAHDLWHDVLGTIVEPPERERLTRDVVNFYDARGDAHRAVDAALQSGLWQAALGPMMRILGQLDVNVDEAQVKRWLDALPAPAQETPERAFLAALHQRLNGVTTDSNDLLRFALAEFEQRGDLDSATSVVLELGLRSWMLNDDSLWGEVVGAGARIIEAGGARMARAAAMATAVDAERAGDFAAALAVYESLPDRSPLESGHAWMLSMLHGDLDRATAHLHDVVAQTQRDATAPQMLVLRWDAGDPAPLLSAAPEVLTRLVVGSTRDAARRLTAEVMIAANRGVPVDAGLVEHIDVDEARRAGLIAVTHAAMGLLADDEATIAAAFEAQLDEVGWEDPGLRGEIRRYLPYPYLLSARCREWLDACDNLGPVQVALRDLARAVQAGRDGNRIESLPAAESILTWLPLPWSIELAVRLVDQGDRRGNQLLDVLSDVTGAAAHAEVRRLRDRDAQLADAAGRVLAEIPGPPARTARLHVVGEFELRHDEAEPEDVRLRVRQLLTLLTLRTNWTRSQLAETLWPGDEARARTNLRTTLSHARRLIEPDRQSGEASFTLRQRDDRVWLQRSSHLVVDLWEVEGALDLADVAQADGALDRALAECRAVVAMWASRPLHVISDVDAVDAEVEERRRRVLYAGGWAAERLLATGQTTDAVAVAEQLLEFDPDYEPAHNVVIGALLATSDLTRAGAAIERMRASLADLGVEPSAGTTMLFRRYERRRAQPAPALDVAEFA